MVLDINKIRITNGKEEPSKKRLRQLDRSLYKQRKNSGKLHSFIIRTLRLIVPLVAISLIGLLIAWPHIEETLSPIQDSGLILPPTIAKNELINPRFESQDDKSQPFTITAKRAIQSSKDADVILLDTPMADIILNDNTWLAAQAIQGAYRQNEERLLLKGEVKLFHDQGYELKTEQLLVNLKTRQARSDVPVTGQGPAGTIEAQGMIAQMETGLLIFKGPVKLVLNRKIEGL